MNYLKCTNNFAAICRSDQWFLIDCHVAMHDCQSALDYIEGAWESVPVHVIQILQLLPSAVKCLDIWQLVFVPKWLFLVLIYQVLLLQIYSIAIPITLCLSNKNPFVICTYSWLSNLNLSSMYVQSRSSQSQLLP